MKIKTTFDWGMIFGLIICFIVLLRANDVIFKYIAFAGIIYLLKGNGGE